MAGQLHKDGTLHDRAARRGFLLPKQLPPNEGPHRLELRLHVWRAWSLVRRRYQSDQILGSSIALGAYVQAVCVVRSTRDAVEPTAQEQHISRLDAQLHRCWRGPWSERTGCGGSLFNAAFDVEKVVQTDGNRRSARMSGARGGGLLINAVAASGIVGRGERNARRLPRLVSLSE